LYPARQRRLVFGSPDHKALNELTLLAEDSRECAEFTIYGTIEVYNMVMNKGNKPLSKPASCLGLEKNC